MNGAKVLYFLPSSEGKEHKKVDLNQLLNKSINNLEYPLIINEIISLPKEMLIESYKNTLENMKNEIKKLLILRIALKKNGMRNNENEIDKEVLKRFENELYLNNDDNIKNIIEKYLNEEIDDNYIIEGKELGIDDMIINKIYDNIKSIKNENNKVLYLNNCIYICII